MIITSCQIQRRTVWIFQVTTEQVQNQDLWDSNTPVDGNLKWPQIDWTLPAWRRKLQMVTKQKASSLFKNGSLFLQHEVRKPKHKHYHFRLQSIVFVILSLSIFFFFSFLWFSDRIVKRCNVLKSRRSCVASRERGVGKLNEPWTANESLQGDLAYWRQFLDLKAEHGALQAAADWGPEAGQVQTLRLHLPPEIDYEEGEFRWVGIKTGAWRASSGNKTQQVHTLLKTEKENMKKTKPWPRSDQRLKNLER